MVDFHATIVFHELLHVFHNLNGERLKVESSRAESQKYSPLFTEEARLLGWGLFQRRCFQKINSTKRLGCPVEPPTRTTQLLFMMTIQ